MKQGWLVVNHFLKTEKFTELYELFCQSAKEKGICLSVKTGGALLGDGVQFFGECALPDFALFWDKDIRLAFALKNMGVRVFNKPRAIFLCDDKSMTHLALAGKCPMPKTVCAPLTYPGVGYSDLSFVTEAVRELGLPMIIKECFGSFGAQVYLVHSEKEAVEKVSELAGTPFLMQEYVKSSHGRDLRLQVVGDRVAAAMLRKNEQGDFRANISGGGSMYPWEATEAQKALALSVCRELGLDFAGVDLLFDENENPVLCEVNSNAHFKNLYDCTGVNVAAEIMSYIAKTLEAEK